MTRIEIGTDAKGNDYAVVDGHTARSLTAAARHLVSNDAPDQPWQAIRADRTVLMFGPSLHRLACMQAQDTDMALRWGWWAPYPGAETAPALLRVVEAAKRARAAQRERLISARREEVVS